MPSTKTLNEVVFAVHFENPISLTVLDLASWSEAFSDFTAHQELAPHQRAELQPQQPSIQMQFAPEMPRIVRRGGRWPDVWVQLQTDRFAIGWNRVSPPGHLAEYPGYPEMWNRWVETVSRFLDWHKSRLGGAPATRLLELAYINVHPVRQNGGSKRISEVLRIYNPPVPSRNVTSFGLNWSERVGDTPNSGQVSGAFQVGAIATGEPAFVYSFAGLMKSANDPRSDAAKAQMDQLHQRIIDMFSASIIFEAEKE